MPNKIVSAADAAALVKDGDTLTTSGFVGIGVPDELLSAIETRFLETGAPRDLSVVFAAGQGDGKTRGLNRLGHDGLLKRVVGGHWGLIPKIAALATEGKIEGWNLPQGVISHLYREIAAGKPGLLSRVGLETFVDPRNMGGRVNDISTDTLVELMEIAGEEMLFYHAPKIAPKLTVALLRGTTADEAGNVSMEREALILDNLAQAMAVKNAGGVVIVQVERVARAGSLNAREVVIPGAFVDAVVVAKADNHMQTYKTAFSHAFTNRVRPPAGEIAAMALDARKVIARRCAFELPIGGIVNLGIGMPEGVAAVAAEEQVLDHVTQNAQFDFYDGGGLDMACLGLAQADAVGNVNVSRFGTKLAGAGGFINISQNAQRVVFAGTFTAGGLDVGISDDGLEIRSEGRARKFLDRVEQITFSGERAGRLRQPVLYVTERCVFELTPKGLKLIEIAPGIDLDRDVLAHMEARPIIEDVAEMDARLFRDAEMDLRADLLQIDVSSRVALEAGGDRLFLNFGKLRVRNTHDVEAVRRAVEAVCAPLGRRVDVIVNYDGSRIDEEALPHWARMVAALEEKYYGTVTRYSGSAFMRVKLGEAFPDARMHIFETEDQARAYLER